jgi:dihydroxyacetone kinase-like protein
MAFLNSVGASTGPLYATGLRRAAQALTGATDATPAAQAAILKGIADGVRERGKGRRGDKTMLDALIPAADAAANAVRQSASVEAMWREIVAAAEAGAASTRSMVASKGRAARLGERALGHLDPGAASAVVILRAMAVTFCEGGPGNVKMTSERAGRGVRKSDSALDAGKGFTG